jgi:hypothetical protein
LYKGEKGIRKKKRKKGKPFPSAGPIPAHALSPSLPRAALPRPNRPTSTRAHAPRSLPLSLTDRSAPLASRTPLSLSRARYSSNGWVPVVSPFFPRPHTVSPRSPPATILPSPRHYSCASEVRHCIVPRALYSRPHTAPSPEPSRPRCCAHYRRRCAPHRCQPASAAPLPRAPIKGPP